MVRYLVLRGEQVMTNGSFASTSTELRWTGSQRSLSRFQTTPRCLRAQLSTLLLIPSEIHGNLPGVSSAARKDHPQPQDYPLAFGVRMRITHTTFNVLFCLINIKLLALAW